jgi:hypothetical protein
VKLHFACQPLGFSGVEGLDAARDPLQKARAVVVSVGLLLGWTQAGDAVLVVLARDDRLDVHGGQAGGGGDTLEFSGTDVCVSLEGTDGAPPRSSASG